MNLDSLSHLEIQSYAQTKDALFNLIPAQLSTVTSVLSLDKALQPLLSLIPYLPKWVSMVKEKCLQPADELTSDQSASILLYTMDSKLPESSFRALLDAALRSQQRDQLQPWMWYLQLFLQSLSRLPTSSTTVYSMSPVGVQSLDRVFTSSTFLFARSSIDDRVNVIIECQSGRDIRDHCYEPRKETILLMAWTQYEVLSSTGEHVHLKEMPSNHSLMFIDNDEGHSSMHLSGHLVSSISSTNIQSRSKVESMEKYIDRSVRLQQKIDTSLLFGSIDLTDQSLDDQDIALVIQHAIVKKHCSLLRLDENFLTWKSAKVLADVLQTNRTLIGLNLSSNRLCDRGVVELLSRNASNCLEKLHLGSNKISNEGVLQLARVLRTNTRLTVLWLDDNHVGDEGLHHLLDVLTYQNRTLRTLSLKGNQLITNVNLEQIRQCLQTNQSLKEVDLSHCGLTKDQYRRLTELSKEYPHAVLRLDVEPAGCLIA